MRTRGKVLHALTLYMHDLFFQIFCEVGFSQIVFVLFAYPLSLVFIILLCSSRLLSIYNFNFEI